MWAIFLRQWDDVMVLVLMAATAVAFFLGEQADAIAISIIVLLNAILGFIQEYRAEAALLSLQEMTPSEVKVKREGILKMVASRQLVPGDIIHLDAGDRVPADCRVLADGEARVDESFLTGESLPVGKKNDNLEENVHLTDRTNMLYQGSVVVGGKIKAVTVATGTDTELGGIADLLTDDQLDKEPPLQRNLDQLAKVLVWVCLGVSIVIAAAGILRGKAPYDMFFAGVSLAVAAIPEGLPAVVTIALAMGVQRMASQNAIVRHLHSVETLGCASVICSDKTGTLTANRLRLQLVEVDGQRWKVNKAVSPRADEPGFLGFWLCLWSSVWASNVALATDDNFRRRGDPTEVALVEGLEGLLPEVRRMQKSGQLSTFTFDRSGEISFSSSRRRMSVWGDLNWGGDVHHVLLQKGAPETMLADCEKKWCASSEDSEWLIPAERKRLMERAEALAGQGYRVLAAAGRKITEREIDDDIKPEESGLTFLGFLAMMDPPRPECREALKQCERASIRTLMLTGDHPLTAKAVAKQLGMWDEAQDEDVPRILTGSKMQQISDKQLADALGTCRVFARVTPEQKLRLVRILRNMGHVVAMTGDGVNDAPAVNQAHIGVAMGQTGTDVTRDAADLVLLDDNFATIVNAVREGRGVFRNIRKFIVYLLSCNIGEVLLMFGATLANLPHPLVPIQILLVNLLTDGLPAMALGMDTAGDELMDKVPRNVGAGVFAHGISQRIMRRGFLIGLTTLSSFVAFMSLGSSLPHARTAALTTLVFSQLIHALEMHYEDKGAAGYIKSNPYLPLAVLSSLAIAAAGVYVPLLASVLNVVPLHLSTLGICAGFAIVAPIVDNLLPSIEVHNK